MHHDQAVGVMEKYIEELETELDKSRKEQARLWALLNRQPKWLLMKDGKPVPLSAVDQALVEAIFAPDEDELEIPLSGGGES